MQSSKKRQKISTNKKTDPEICPICIESIHQKDYCKLPCGHAFHTICLCKWIVFNRICPVCRTDNLSCSHYRSSKEHVQNQSHEEDKTEKVEFIMRHDKKTIKAVVELLLNEITSLNQRVKDLSDNVFRNEQQILEYLRIPSNFFLLSVEGFDLLGMPRN